MFELTNVFNRTAHQSLKRRARGLGPPLDLNLDFNGDDSYNIFHEGVANYFEFVLNGSMNYCEFCLNIEENWAPHHFNAMALYRAKATQSAEIYYPDFQIFNTDFRRELRIASIASLLHDVEDECEDSGAFLGYPAVFSTRARLRADDVTSSHIAVSF